MEGKTITAQARNNGHVCSIYSSITSHSLLWFQVESAEYARTVQVPLMTLETDDNYETWIGRKTDRKKDVVYEHFLEVLRHARLVVSSARSGTRGSDAAVMERVQRTSDMLTWRYG